MDNIKTGNFIKELRKASNAAYEPEEGQLLPVSEKV